MSMALKTVFVLHFTYKTQQAYKGTQTPEYPQSK